jgi:cbb3-type cytochrome oxidase maturation protein
MNLIRTLITVGLFIAFIGLWVWAWRAGRHADFAAAARLPLETDCDTESGRAS